MADEKWNSDPGSDGEDEEDSTAHAKLLADIDSIAKPKTQPKASSGMRHITMASGGVDLGALASLERKELKSSKRKEADPVPKHTQKRASRKQGYETMAEELNKWAGVVHQMRTARQVTFPLKEQKVSLFEQDHSVRPYIKTDLQKKLFGLVYSAGLMKSKEESEQEKAVREALSLEEVKERNKDAWRLRVLRDKIGRKAHYRNKTKSKKFHRELKKDRLKKQAAELENLKKADPSKALEKLQELEDIRIEERMSLKHKKSKWAAQLQRRANTDKEALAKLQENARLHTELVQKLQQQQNDLLQQQEEEAGSSDAASDEESENDPTEAVTKNATPAPGVAEQSYIKMKKFWSEYNKQKEDEMKDRLEEIRAKKTSKKKDTEEQTIENAEKIIQKEISTLKKKKAKSSDSAGKESQKPKVTEYEFTFDSDKPDTPMNEGVVRLQTLEDFESLGPDKTSASGNADSSAAPDTGRHKQLKALPEVDATKVKKLETKVLAGTKTRVSDLFNDDDSDGEADEHNELFDEDDTALEEFNKQKAAAEEAAQPKDECYALPGWGEWSTPDCLISKKKMEKFTIKAPKKPPVKRGNVIYNEKADLHPGIRELMVKELPYPFKSVADWEASIRFPLSRTFIPETVHQKLIAPRVVRKAGHVIKPMDQTQLFNQPDIKRAVKRKMETFSGDKTDENVPKKTMQPMVKFNKSTKKFSRTAVASK